MHMARPRFATIRAAISSRAALIQLDGNPRPMPHRGQQETSMAAHPKNEPPHIRRLSHQQCQRLGFLFGLMQVKFQGNRFIRMA